MCLFSESQALDIPFEVISISEACADYRSVFQINNTDRTFEHIYDDIKAQVARRPCLLHPASRRCDAIPAGVSMLFTGSPCDPFSALRTKRYADGSVKEHPDFLTTFRDVAAMYARCLPVVGVLEQVLGFLRPFSTTDTTTPYEQLR